MLIQELKVFVLEPFGPFRFWEDQPPTYYNAILFQVIAEDGTTGNCITWIHPDVADINEQLPFYKKIMVGKDPHFVEQFLQQATFGLEFPNNTASAFDIATWDLIGKLHNEPVYKLLGAYRDKLPAYASTFTHKTDDDYIEMALACKAAGYRGLKLHPYGVPDSDIRLCKAVREAVGPEFPLMVDSVYAYSRADALRVGKVLGDLNYYWYECPLPESDKDGLKMLRNKLHVPIAASEAHYTGLADWTRYLREDVCDVIRGIGDVCGGITGLRKMAYIAEGFHVNFESHSFGPPSSMAAHLHVMLAQKNCAWFEMPVPCDNYNKYSKDLITIDETGYIHAPTKPGLGYDLDFDVINANILREIDGKPVHGETCHMFLYAYR